MAKGKSSLPSFSKTPKHSSGGSFGGGSGGGSFNIGGIIGIVVGVLIVLFILLGGINQKAFVETMIDIAKNIGNAFTSCVDKVDVDVTDSGIYVKPADSNGGLITGHPSETNNSENTNSNIEFENTSSNNTESNISITESSIE